MLRKRRKAETYNIQGCGWGNERTGFDLKTTITIKIYNYRNYLLK